MDHLLLNNIFFAVQISDHLTEVLAQLLKPFRHFRKLCMSKKYAKRGVHILESVFSEIRSFISHVSEKHCDKPLTSTDIQETFKGEQI